MNSCQCHSKTIIGFTILELMVTLSVIAILAAIAVPVVRTPIEKQRLVATAETLLGDLRWARSESIKRNRRISVNFTIGANWSYCIDLDQTCQNPLKTVEGAQFRGTTLGTQFRRPTLASVDFDGTSTIFDPVRGINDRDGKANITTEQFSATIFVSPLGHARICDFPEAGYRNQC